MNSNLPRFKARIDVAPRWTRPCIEAAELHAATRRWPRGHVLVSSRTAFPTEPLPGGEALDPEGCDEDGLIREDGRAFVSNYALDGMAPEVERLAGPGFRADLRRLVPAVVAPSVVLVVLKHGADGLYDDVIVTELVAPDGFKPQAFADWKIYAVDAVPGPFMVGRRRIEIRHTPVVGVAPKHVVVVDRGREVRLTRRALLKDGQAHDASDPMGAGPRYARDYTLEADPFWGDFERTDGVLS